MVGNAAAALIAALALVLTAFAQETPPPSEAPPEAVAEVMAAEIVPPRALPRPTSCR